MFETHNIWVTLTPVVLWVHTAPSVSEFTLDSRELTEEVNTIDLSLTSAGGLTADTSVEIGERAILVR